jgi:two-component system response regulator RpaA
MKNLTVNQAAKICRVAPRTVVKWVDSGRMKGYKIPATGLRTIPAVCLQDFLTAHGINTPVKDLI